MFKHPLRKLLFVVIFSSIMAAQPPTVIVNDDLSGVRIFSSASPDFAKIAASLGVDATLPTLGASASLVVAIRNDSGEAIDSMRLLFQVEKGGPPFPRIILQGDSLAAGQATLTAPSELAGAVTALMHYGTSGLSLGSPPAHLLDVYQGATVTASIDSATLASGRFIGADTLNFFPRLIEEQTAKRSFFADLATQSKTLTASEIEPVLVARQSAADAAKGKAKSPADLSLAAIAEFDLCMQALMALKHSGLSDLGSWAEQENEKWSSRPTLHR